MGSAIAVAFVIGNLFAAPPQVAALAALFLGADGVSGEWTIRLGAEGQSTEYSLELTQSGETVRGAMVSPRSKNKYPIEEGSFRDSTLRFKIPGKKAEVVAKLQGKRLEGTYKTEQGSVKLLGEPNPKAQAGKKPALAGKWRATVRLPDDREMTGLLEVIEREGKLSGSLSVERGSVDFKSVAVGEDGKVVMVLVIPSDSGDREYAVEAAFDGPDRLKGRWSARDGSLAGEWSARRETPPKPAARSALGARYRVFANLPDGGILSVEFQPKVVEERLSGTIIVEGEKIQIAKGTFRDGQIAIECDIPYQGVISRVEVTGKVGEKGVLEGTWRTDNGSGEWIARPVMDL